MHGIATLRQQNIMRETFESKQIDYVTNIDQTISQHKKKLSRLGLFAPADPVARNGTINTRL